MEPRKMNARLVSLPTKDDVLDTHLYDTEIKQEKPEIQTSNIDENTNIGTNESMNEIPFVSDGFGHTTSTADVVIENVENGAISRCNFNKDHTCENSQESDLRSNEPRENRHKGNVTRKQKQPNRYDKISTKSKTPKNNKCKARQTILHDITRNANPKTSNEKISKRCKYKQIEPDKQRNVTNKSELKNNTHSIDVHCQIDKPYVCTVCSKIFKRKDHLKRHMGTHSGVKVAFPCSVCQKGFNDKHLLQRHMKTHTGDRAYVCEHCDKRFVDRYNLNRHLKIHTGDKPHRCAVCDKQFVQLGDLNKHIRIHTGDEPYKCPVCGQSFGRSHALKRHMRRHTGEKPYKCETCGNRFGRKDTLTMHMKTHSGDTPLHSCTICNEKFSSLFCLENHKSTHIGEKSKTSDERTKMKCYNSFKSERRFKCGVCGKGLISNRDLEVHLRTHTGERPYVCEVCNKGFICLYKLKVHLRIHTGEIPYTCNICFREFRCGKSIKKHKMVHK